MSDKPQYRDTAYLMVVGSWNACNSFYKIFDAIHLNGCTGHSFRVMLYQDKKPVFSAGGFDGDGADGVYCICSGSSDSNLNFDMVVSKIETQDTKQGTNKGDNVLVVKGTYCGIQALTEIMKNTLNLEKTTEDRVDVYTDDNEKIKCGSWHSYSSKIYPNEEDSFGFAIVTTQDGPWSNPIKWFTEHGYDIGFFRGHVD